MKLTGLPFLIIGILAFGAMSAFFELIASIAELFRAKLKLPPWLDAALAAICLIGLLSFVFTYKPY